jgi:hypothetical protein
MIREPKGVQNAKEYVPNNRVGPFKTIKLMKKNQNKSVQNTVLESKEEDEQTVVVVLKFASETLLSPSNIALVKRNPSLRPATKSSELIKFARRVKLCFVHLCYGWVDCRVFS